MIDIKSEHNDTQLVSLILRSSYNGCIVDINCVLATRQEGPPSYQEVTEGQPEVVVVDSKSPPTPSASTSAVRGPPATNFLRISRLNGSIKDTWTIDPTLAIPDAVLSPLAAGEQRHNVKIDGFNGSITAGVHLISGNGPLSPVKASIDITNKNGSITVTVVCLGYFT